VFVGVARPASLAEGEPPMNAITAPRRYRDIDNSDIQPSS
jgi:hypothetical protein